MANLPPEAEAAARSEPSNVPLDTAVVDPTELHRSKQRRLLFAIQLTLLALVLLLSSPGSPQIGVLLALFALLIALSGL